MHKSKGETMAKKFFLLALVIGMFVFPYIGESQTNQTVITVTRDQELVVPSTAGMEIYIDGNLYTTPGRRPQAITLRRGETATIPVFYGTHTISVQIGRLFESETIQFTVDANTSASFLATTEEERGLVLIKQ